MKPFELRLKLSPLWRAVRKIDVEVRRFERQDQAIEQMEVARRTQVFHKGRPCGARYSGGVVKSPTAGVVGYFGEAVPE